eukprot:TRINITY_DN90533_c0_g1_i1.p1 TRINITY_DN90533_c0_g1~~TRINITY_DN90533_c0_g1_i1.p1  ORF type:complete len:221 (-),score=21.81 TRINITY_DN90533_c0_g1_i1:23-685(-)
MRELSFDGEQLGVNAVFADRIVTLKKLSQQKSCVYAPAVGFAGFVVLEVLVLSWSGHLGALTDQLVVYGAFAVTIGSWFLCLFATLHIKVEKIYHDLQDEMQKVFHWFTEAHRDRSGIEAQQSSSIYKPSLCFAAFVLFEVLILEWSGHLQQVETQFVVLGVLGLTLCAMLLTLLLTVYIRIDRLFHDVTDKFYRLEHWAEEETDHIRAACQASRPKGCF